MKAPRGLTLDAGALIHLDRNHRPTWALLAEAVERRHRPAVPAPALTQAWRSARQANLARALRHCVVVATDGALARRAGELCAATGQADAVDAVVVATAGRRGDAVATTDPGDIDALAAHAPGVAVIPL